MCTYRWGGVQLTFHYVIFRCSQLLPLWGSIVPIHCTGYVFCTKKKEKKILSKIEVIKKKEIIKNKQKRTGLTICIFDHQTKKKFFLIFFPYLIYYFLNNIYHFSMTSIFFQRFFHRLPLLKNIESPFFCNILTYLENLKGWLGKYGSAKDWKKNGGTRSNTCV